MATIGPKKDGGPNIEFFQSPESLAQFDQIRVWLQKNCKKHVQTDPPTKEGLAQLVIQLIQYQENKLGKNASDPPFLRLPMKVFMDMKPGGSLCTVLATMFRFKSEQRWRKFDFQVGKVCTAPHAASLTAPPAPARPQTPPDFVPHHAAL